jgi:hypothetical protein
MVRESLLGSTNIQFILELLYLTYYSRSTAKRTARYCTLFHKRRKNNALLCIDVNVTYILWLTHTTSRRHTHVCKELITNEHSAVTFRHVNEL